MVVTAAALAGVAGVAGPAVAAPADKAQVLSSWTQDSAAGARAWAAADADRGAWSAYGFDWSTDYCTTSPDNPLGFPFKTACTRHDFGYRNYTAAGSLAANKSRLDSAFYGDLKRICATYSGVKKTSCDATAWTYYQAVDKFGSAAAVRGAAVGAG
ncbi:phospholipase [Streptomyces sp. NPDC006172]|uniref:phospholipase n=1 Tax=Streptomyces sp. NPDC006172 TaxID=3154470 RepID=UPI0034071B5C